MKVESFQRFPELVGEDSEDTTLLTEMAREARAYISAFDWCPPVRAIYLAYGVGGVVGVFLFKFSKKIQGSDDTLWVIVGDLPSAYLVLVPNDSPADALERYCGLMEDWVAAARGQRDMDDVFPVAVEATEENADLLDKRIGFLRTEILPEVARQLPK
jgi:hypothetical protein